VVLYGEITASIYKISGITKQTLFNRDSVSADAAVKTENAVRRIRAEILLYNDPNYKGETENLNPDVLFRN